MGLELFDLSVVGVTFKKCRVISASQVLQIQGLKNLTPF